MNLEKAKARITAYLKDHNLPGYDVLAYIGETDFGYVFAYGHSEEMFTPTVYYLVRNDSIKSYGDLTINKLRYWRASKEARAVYKLVGITPLFNSAEEEQSFEDEMKQSISESND